MENYIFVNGQKIELTDEQIAQIIASANKPSVTLSDIAVGDTCKIGEYEFIILEHYEETTAVICKELIGDIMAFGSCNNYDNSDVDNACNKFADEIAAVVGVDNVVPHTVDLTSDDGLKDYGTVERRASLITAEMYRRYVEILDKFKPDCWWWLATAYSTKKHDNDSWVKCVSPSGFVLFNFYCNGDFGVRPFCILKSNIFVSK